LQKKAPNFLESLDAKMESPRLGGSSWLDRRFGRVTLLLSIDFTRERRRFKFPGSETFGACKPLRFPKTEIASAAQFEAGFDRFQPFVLTCGSDNLSAKSHIAIRSGK
jgi:hypothetical protein